MHSDYQELHLKNKFEKGILCSVEQLLSNCVIKLFERKEDITNNSSSITNNFFEKKGIGCIHILDKTHKGEMHQ